MSDLKTKKAMAALLKLPAVASWRMLMSVYQNYYSKLAEAMAKDGVSYSRFQILYLLYFEGPTSATCLAQKLLVSRANISTFSRRLELDGLILQRPLNPGSKRKNFHLTAKGEKIFEKVAPAHVRRVQKLIKPFSASAMKELRKLNDYHECEEEYF